jgi:alpha-L-fucosidase
MEMVSFVHFTTNTFTDMERGYGDEPDPLQWATVLNNTGFKELIFTCKHHDGFCLWPFRYTEHSIKNSPYKKKGVDVSYPHFYAWANLE